MPALMLAGPLDAFRAPLSHVRLREWILTGRQTLDGLVCLKSRVGDAWPQALSPWFDLAGSVAENERLVWLRFAVPTELDCDRLGACMPVQRQAGLFATARIALDDAGAQKALRDQLLVVDGGEKALETAADMRRIDLASLYAIDGLESSEAQDLPALPRRPEATILRTVVANAVTAADITAGFATVAESTRTRPKWRPRKTVRSSGSVFVDIRWIYVIGSLLLAAFAASVIGMIIASWSVPTHIAAPPPSPSSGHWSDKIFGPLVMVIAMIAARWMFFGGAGEEKRTAQSSNPSPTQPGKPAVPATPARPGWFSRLCRRLFGERTERSVGSAGVSAPRPPSVGSAGVSTPRPPSIGLLRRLAAWLFWHSPAADRLLREYERRLREVEDLFRRGLIEEALRRAVALDDGRARQRQRDLFGGYGDLPLSGPDIRRSLNLQYGERPAGASLPMNPKALHQTSELYRRQAGGLASRGDIEHAVFIFAELLDDARAAVDVLVGAGRFETAARLAQGRRLPAGVFIPLWYRAGKKERALALAARHDAFQELWKELKPDDPFRLDIARAWSERLASAGDIEGALTVSDGLAVPGREDCIRLGLDGEMSGPILARAMKALPWRQGDHDIHARFDALLADTTLASERLVFAEALLDPAVELTAHARLQEGRRAYVIHRLIRSLLLDDAAHGRSDPRTQIVGRLADAGGQFALRTELRRLNRTAPLGIEALTEIIVPASTQLASLVNVVRAGHGRMLLGYRSGLVRLVNRAGAEVWRVQLNGLIDLIPIEDGHKVLALRDDFGERHLSVIDARAGRHTEWGVFPVSQWHHTAHLNGWMIKSGDRFMHVDIAALLAGMEMPAAERELTCDWVIPMSEPGDALAFVRDRGYYACVLQRYDGLIEIWTINSATMKVEWRYWINPGYPDVGSPWQTVMIQADLPDFNHPLRRRTAAGAYEWINAKQLDREAEIAALDAYYQQFPFGPPAILQIVFSAAANLHGWTAQETEDGVDINVVRSNDGIFKVRMMGASRAWARFAQRGEDVIVFDDLGRVLCVDATNGAVLARLV